MTTKSQIHPLKCKNCNKEYIRQSVFDKHRLLCIEGAPATLTPLTPHIAIGGKEDKGEKGCTPSGDPTASGIAASGIPIGTEWWTGNKKISPSGEPTASGIALENVSLRDVIFELVKSNNKMQKDMEEVKKWMQSQKKKINIIERLNKTCKPTENYKEFISKLSITHEHLQIVFKSNIIDGIQEILQEYMKQHERENDIPFQCVDIKKDTIYVYSEESKWEILSSENFNNIVSILSKNILTEFQKWIDENQHQLYAEDFSTIYIQNLKKVIGGDISIDKQRSRIHKNLYNYLIK